MINEVLSHTDPPVELTDSIELYNTTDAPIDIGGWYLSDAASKFTKYQIPRNTILGPGNYIVFDESQGYHRDPPPYTEYLARDGQTLCPRKWPFPYSAASFPACRSRAFA